MSNQDRKIVGRLVTPIYEDRRKEGKSKTITYAVCMTCHSSGVEIMANPGDKVICETCFETVSKIRMVNNF